MSSAAVPQAILAAVDFEEASASAVALAGLIAQTLGARLTVLHAESAEVPPYLTSAQVRSMEAERQQSRAAAAAYLREFVARATPVNTETRLVAGTATDAILLAAGEFDLVVVGTHGRRGPRRWWLGSVAERVVRGAAVPVIVTHALEPDALDRISRRLSSFKTGCAASPAYWTDALGLALETRVYATDIESVAHAVRSCASPALFVPDTVSG
jgi:nucleotide-binding universal stress UspA family protein